MTESTQQGVGMCLFTVVLVVSAVPAATAETVTAEGTITSVDAQNHTLSVSRDTSSGQKTGTFKVAQDAKITVAGRDSGIDSLKAQQTVTLTYDTRLGAVTRIEASGEANKTFRDLEYANVDGQSLKLDLYLPKKTDRKPPLLVWIHGGGWTKGTKTGINPIFVRLTADGYAAASIDYRLDGLDSHPKQIHDCKGAIRWLRANADKYGYDVTRIGAGGASAGGHLVLLLGLSTGVKELEGDVGGNLDQSSQVHAIVDLFGPSDVELFAKKSDHFRRNKAPRQLLKSASPLTYLTKDDPPLLILHGDKDKLVPLSQSEHIHKLYQEMGLESSLHVIEGAGPGSPQFNDSARYELVKQFFARHIKHAGAAE